MLSYLRVSFVGGSYRQTNGYWHRGCYQAVIKNYTYHVFEGYDMSYNSCIYCDYIGGPFAARTSLLKQLISSECNDVTMFVDLWIKARNDHIGMVCPDVMFETTGTDGVDVKNRTYWITLARKYKLNLIKFPRKTYEVSFSCDI